MHVKKRNYFLNFLLIIFFIYFCLLFKWPVFTLKLRVLARLIYKLMLAFSDWGTLIFIYRDLFVGTHNFTVFKFLPITYSFFRRYHIEYRGIISFCNPLPYPQFLDLPPVLISLVTHFAIGYHSTAQPQVCNTYLVKFRYSKKATKIWPNRP